MRKVTAVPLTEQEFAARAKQPARFELGRSATLPPGFWWLWAGGTVVPLLIGILGSYTASRSGGVLLLLVSLCYVTFGQNIYLAIRTRGYKTGDLAEPGQRIAVAAGWLFAGLPALAVYVVVIAILFAVLWSVFVFLELTKD